MSKKVETILKELVEKANKERQSTIQRREKFKRKQQKTTLGNGVLRSPKPQQQAR